MSDDSEADMEKGYATVNEVPYGSINGLSGISIPTLSAGLEPQCSHKPKDSAAAEVPMNPRKVTGWIENDKLASEGDGDDVACSNLFKVYVGVAERYDKGVMESWKDDMQSLLIFSGLFSAILTAFIIEGYKDLKPQDQTPSAGQGQMGPPSRTAHATNILWFSSLGFSLTCSLLATLIDQWTREFLHQTDQTTGPVRRARVFSFLYSGSKTFYMRSVVNIVPLLLHLSVFCFFGGLIAFLRPIYTTLMFIMVGFLVVTVVIYTGLTVLPLVRRDCPYQTPLTRPLWLGKEALRTYLRPRSYSKPYDSVPYMDAPVGKARASRLAGRLGKHYNMAEAVMVHALRDPQSRDADAVSWTLGSLTDDFELLPFVEAIPDAICGPKGFRHGNDMLFRQLLCPDSEYSDPLLCITMRTIALLESAQSLDLSLQPELRTSRQTASSKAIWALLMLSTRYNVFNVEFSERTLTMLASSDSTTKDTDISRRYTLPITAALQYSRVKAILLIILDMKDAIQECASQDQLCNRLKTHLAAIQANLFTAVPPWLDDWYNRISYIMEDDSDWFDGVKLKQLKDEINNVAKHYTAHQIFLRVNVLMDFLEACVKLDAAPYQLSTTCSEIFPDAIIRHIDVRLFHDADLALVRRIALPSEPCILEHDIAQNALPCLPLFEDQPAEMRSFHQFVARISIRPAPNIVYVLQRCNKSVLKTHIMDDIQRRNSALSMGLEDGFLLRQSLWALTYHTDQIWGPQLANDWCAQLFEILFPMDGDSARSQFSSPEMIIASYHALKQLGYPLKHIRKRFTERSLGSENTSLKSARSASTTTTEEQLERLCQDPFIVRLRPGIGAKVQDIRSTYDTVLNDLAQVRIRLLLNILSNIIQAKKQPCPAETAKLLCRLSMASNLGDVDIPVETQRDFAQTIQECVQAEWPMNSTSSAGGLGEYTAPATAVTAIPEVLSVVFQHLSIQWTWITDYDAAAILNKILWNYTLNPQIDISSRQGARNLAKHSSEIVRISGDDRQAF